MLLANTHLENFPPFCCMFSVLVLSLSIRPLPNDDETLSWNENDFFRIKQYATGTRS
jgi:hypothetical protein